MAPADAWYLFASDRHTDQLLVYGFAGCPASVERAVDDVLERARSCPELRLRVGQRHFNLGIPEWVPGDVDAGQIAVHVSDEFTWSGCLKALGSLVEQQQLDPREALWRLHVFVGVRGVPANAGQPSTVIILQVSHALGDGTRSAALAGFLLGRNAALPALAAPPVRGRVPSVVQALRQRRQLDRDTVAGAVPPPPAPVPALSINDPPRGAPILRTFVRHRAQLPGPSATVGALVAISEALSGYLRERGEDTSTLTALVPMTKPGVPHARNHSGPEYIRLHPEVTVREQRAHVIAGELEVCQRRRLHPAFLADEIALAALPGPVLRWVATRTKPPTVLAHSVVSSVNRGAADLEFGGCPVVMTAGYPFLTSNIGLTHGIHGIGDMIAISVNTTESIIPDIDGYLDRLTASLRP
ncbi:WS/DGAT domain-containing protein [Mycolicibacterium sp.]|uniref:WS/DGAT domain-containing protein n=1 Tax=Mycolicibacterium sp. TaxID=2320850 RepID=UPI0025FC088C|nr:WS/DGAT domain-containing protein [Mycolicibacterium sp.]